MPWPMCGAHLICVSLWCFQVYLWACFTGTFWNTWRVWEDGECCFAWFYKEEEAQGT